MNAVETTATHAAVRPFSDLSKGDVDYAGGKGANLGELTRAGVPVPPGFVVGAPAYAAFADDNGLRERVEIRLDGLHEDDTAVDRDSELVAEVFDEREPAVTEYLRQLITRARELGLQTSICGQAPSVYPEYADLLVSAGIDNISVNMDVVDRTRRLVAAAEQRLLVEAARR